MSKISSNIKKFRTKSGMTQEDLATEIHVTRQTVSSWETGRTQPDLQILQTLAAAFGIEIEELIYGKRKNAEEEKEKEKLLFSNTLVTVLSILGCLLIGAGVVLIFVKFWRDFPDALKIFTCFVPAILGQTVGVYTYINKKESLPWREGASVLWLLGTGVTTSVLMSQLNYNVIGDSVIFLFITVSAFVLMLVFRTLSPLAVVYTFSLIWFNTVLDEKGLDYISKTDSPGDTMNFVLIVIAQALLIGFLFIASAKFYKKENDIIRYTFSSWINFLGLAAFIFYAVLRTPVGESVVSLVILAAIICFIAGQKHTDFVSPYRMLGLPASAASLCFLGIIFALGHNAERWVDVAVLIAGLVPFVLFFWKKTRPDSVYLRVYGALLTGALTVYNIISLFDDVVSPEKYNTPAYDMFELAQKSCFTVSFLLSVSALIMLIVYGAKERKLLYLNMGFILSCVTVIAKLYLLDMGLIVTGIMLIVCGAALLFINLKISRMREKEQSPSLGQGEEEVQ